MISPTLKRSAYGVASASVLALTNVQFAFAAAKTTAASSCDDSTLVTSGVTGGAQCAAPSSVSQNLSVGGLLQNVSNILIFLVGAISVIVLIIGGLRYVISAGNASQVQGAKNTILYAIVGIVISISAYAIVQFVFKQIGVNG